MLRRLSDVTISSIEKILHRSKEANEEKKRKSCTENECQTNKKGPIERKPSLYLRILRILRILIHLFLVLVDENPKVITI